jgi:hypothetical protein
LLKLKIYLWQTLFKHNQKRCFEFRWFWSKIDWWGIIALRETFWLELDLVQFFETELAIWCPNSKRTIWLREFPTKPWYFIYIFSICELRNSLIFDILPGDKKSFLLRNNCWQQHSWLWISRISKDDLRYYKSSTNSKFLEKLDRRYKWSRGHDIYEWYWLRIIWALESYTWLRSIRWRA